MTNFYLGKLTTLVLLFLLLLITSNDSYADCSKDLRSVRQSNLQVFQKVGFLITELAASCGNTDEYKLELGSYYIALQDYDLAEEYFTKVFQTSSTSRHSALLGIGNVYLHQERYSEAIDRYTLLVDEYSTWDIGYEYLGTAYVLAGKYSEAVKVLERGAGINSQNERIWKYLGFANYYLSRPNLAIKNFNKATSINKNLLLDKNLMIAASRSYVEIGKYDVAESLLVLLANNVNGIKTDEEFLLAVKYLKDHAKK